jgi:hypothetical protein
MNPGVLLLNAARPGSLHKGRSFLSGFNLMALGVLWDTIPLYIFSVITGPAR